MKTFFHGAAPFVLMGVASTAAFGQVTKKGAGYDIKVRYTAGQTINYTLGTQVKMATGPQGKPMNQNQTGTIRQKVVSVKNGVATLNVTTSGGPMGGRTTTTTVKVDQHGKIVSGNSGMNFMTGFPTHPLRIGESWKSTTAIPQLGGAGASVVYTFRGLRSVGGRQVAQIDFVVTMAGQFALNGRGAAYLNPADGQLFSSTVNANLKMTPPGTAPKGSKPMTMSLTSTMKRS